MTKNTLNKKLLEIFIRQHCIIISFDPPEDGSAVCEELFDREYAEKLNKELLRKEQKEIDEILDADY